eukprot:3411296-Prymnesium_polylepis.1
MPADAVSAAMAALVKARATASGTSLTSLHAALMPAAGGAGGVTATPPVRPLGVGEFAELRPPGAESLTAAQVVVEIVKAKSVTPSAFADVLAKVGTPPLGHADASSTGKGERGSSIRKAHLLN